MNSTAKTNGQIKPMLKTSTRDYESSRWTDNEITSLHEAILKDSLLTLQDLRCSPKTRKGVMNWILVPLVEDDQAHPFSFQECCRLSFLNSEDMRNRLLSIYSRYFVHQLAA